MGSLVKTVAVIPARLASTRLPEKALVDIAGRPMVAHVVERVLLAKGLSEVIVATDDDRIANVARKAGARPVLTSPGCPSGTDRVAEALQGLDADLVLNIQGDEPLLPADAVEALHRTLVEGLSVGAGMATLARPLDASESGLPQVVKVVLAEDRTALYFSRSIVPFPREPGVLKPLAHVGLYGYTRATLERLSSLAPTALERAEGLEQLRALGHGIRIAVGVGHWKTHAVDTAEDLARVRALVGA
jgi:3-deoxy-manno-octulosonate cytidylyltransferase (CMP-KDO synthetase)